MFQIDLQLRQRVSKYSIKLFYPHSKMSYPALLWIAHVLCSCYLLFECSNSLRSNWTPGEWSSTTSFLCRGIRLLVKLVWVLFHLNGFMNYPSIQYSTSMLKKWAQAVVQWLFENEADIHFAHHSCSVIRLVTDQQQNNNKISTYLSITVSLIQTMVLLIKLKKSQQSRQCTHSCCQSINPLCSQFTTMGTIFFFPNYRAHSCKHALSLKTHRYSKDKFFLKIKAIQLLTKCCTVDYL